MHRIANETVSKQAFMGLIENLQNKASRHRPLWAHVIKQQ